MTAKVKEVFITVREKKKTTKTNPLMRIYVHPQQKSVTLFSDKTRLDETIE